MRKRILFVMPNARYLRLYGDTVLELARRGHEVLLAYDRPEKAAEQPQVPEGAPASVRALGAVPAHSGLWREFLIALGSTVDYVRFLSPRFSSTGYLRSRMEKYLPPSGTALVGIRQLPHVVVALAFRASVFIERAVPADTRLLDYLRGIAPDSLVVTPLVLRGPGGAHQTQVVKAARRLGIPVGLAVGSWDHLSSKGFIRIDPDVVIVWNETQKREAVTLHSVDPRRIVVTGAQAFDEWFGRQPSLTRDPFLQRVGLPAGQPYVLYVGSSRGIAKPQAELSFVREWIAALRASQLPAVRSVSVLVRPHPFNIDHWTDADLSDLGSVAIRPRRRPSFPMNDVDKDDYFHSLYYSAGIVGINTSAMIEAAIVGRQVYTIQVPAFAATQEGTIHFHYLMPGDGGCVETASDFEEHIAQLDRGLSSPQRGHAERERFVRTFVRPHGLGQAAAPLVADAIEKLAGLRSRPVADRPWWLAPVRALLRYVARRLDAPARRRAPQNA